VSIVLSLNHSGLLTPVFVLIVSLKLFAIYHSVSHENNKHQQNKLPCYVPGFISSSKFTSCLFDG